MSTVQCARSRHAALATLLLVCCAATGWAVAQPARPATATSPGSPEPLVVGVTLNAEAKGDFFVFRTAAGDVLMKLDDLKAMGLQQVDGALQQLDGEAHVSLRSVRGVAFTLDSQKGVLALTAQPELLPRRVLDINQPARRTGTIPTETSAFLNYAFTYADGSSYPRTRLGFSSEAGLRYGNNLLLTNSATVERADGSRKHVRLMSSILRDDRATLQRWTVGDFFTPGREFSGGVNLGGLSLSKLYDIDPYLIDHPTQSIRGNVTLPSDLEVYMDGQRVRTERLSPGEFELRDLASYGGARSVRLVLRDAFGRRQELDYSFYATEQPLRAGLHEYSYNAGAFRRRFGTDSNAYGAPAYSAFHRYGFTDALTVGLRAEGTRQLFNGGPSATIVLGSAGVLNAAYAQSSVAGRRGAAATLGYSYQDRTWGFGLAGRRDWGEFASLGEPPSVTNRKSEFSANASVSLGRHGSLSLSHSVLRVYAGRSASTATALQPFEVVALTPDRVTALNYNVSLISGRVALSASLRHIKDTRSRNELFVGLIFFPDRDHIHTSHVRADTEGRRSAYTQYSKIQPIGEGFGYNVSAERALDSSAHSTLLRSNAQYNAPAAVLQGEFNSTRQLGRRDDEHRLGLSGGLAYVAGRLAPSRPVVDSFALVQVGDVPGVGVSVNGQEIGKTNARGELLAPTLRAFYDNEIVIRTQDLPIDRSIETARRKVSPSLRSGALVAFNATRIQAFSGKLKAVRGEQALPLEHQSASFVVQGRQQEFRTGRAGEFYLENIPAGRYAAQASLPGGGSCSFELVIPVSTEMLVELPDMLCRAAP